jgi:rhodanese-related sulfurtransferase
MVPRDFVSKIPPYMIAELLTKGAVLLDVRTHCEHAGYHMEGALNIPYDEIDRMKCFIKDWAKPVITYSSYGRRSHIAYLKLKAFGIEVYDGGTIRDIEIALCTFKKGESDSNSILKTAGCFPHAHVRHAKPRH